MARSKMSRRGLIEARAVRWMLLNAAMVQGKGWAFRRRAASADRFKDAAIFQGSVNLLALGLGANASRFGAISADLGSR